MYYFYFNIFLLIILVGLSLSMKSIVKIIMLLELLFLLSILFASSGSPQLSTFSLLISFSVIDGVMSLILYTLMLQVFGKDHTIFLPL